jgi:hypothetical protein
MRWTAMWRVPRYWNYALRIGPGPARLTIDGKPVLSVPAGSDVQSTEISLALGDHFIEYDGTLAAPGKSAMLEWLLAPTPRPGQPAQVPTWSPIPQARLRVADHGPDGLLGVVTGEGLPEQRRLDGTLSMETMVRETHILDRPFTVKWTGTLRAPVSGIYAMSCFTQGKLDVRTDGRSVLHSDGPRGEPVEGRIDLQAGPHAVEVVQEVRGSSGGLEWTWTPPGAERSIVPRSALTPPPGAGVGPPLPAEALAAAAAIPSEFPIEVGK